jgi:D-amino-acid dehydrogenase
MDELANREGLQYWQTHNGVLYLFHAETDLRTAEHNSRLLREHGRHQEVLDYEQTVTLEPALGHGQRRFAGAIHDTSDGTGDPQ